MNEQNPSTHVVVTGASRGIGHAIAKRLLEDGWHVFNMDIIDPGENGVGKWISTDLADPESIESSMSAILEEGAVSGLVNNAGISGDMALLAETTADDLDRVHAVNVRAPALCARALSQSMKSQKFGRIVNISSRAMLGKANRTSYGGTKGSIASMTKVWAIELAGDGITCNAVAPGPIRTELFEKGNPPSMPRTQKIIDAIPVGRIGECEDIAQPVSFFMDKRSGYITGQVLIACGGTMLTRGGS